MRTLREREKKNTLKTNDRYEILVKERKIWKGGEKEKRQKFAQFVLS